MLGAPPTSQVERSRSVGRTWGGGGGDGAVTPQRRGAAPPPRGGAGQAPGPAPSRTLLLLSRKWRLGSLARCSSGLSRPHHTFKLYLHGARGAGERIPPPPPPTPPPPPPPLPLLTHSESLASLPEVGALRARARRPPARSNPRACRPGPRRRAPISASGSGRFRS